MDLSPSSNFNADSLITQHETNGMTPEEKRERALAHLSGVEPGKRRVKFSLPRETFDPLSRKHLESYRSFLTSGSWGQHSFPPRISLRLSC